MFTDWLLCLEWVTQNLQLDEMRVGFFSPPVKSRENLKSTNVADENWLLLLLEENLSSESLWPSG